MEETNVLSRWLERLERAGRIDRREREALLGLGSASLAITALLERGSVQLSDVPEPLRHVLQVTRELQATPSLLGQQGTASFHEVLPTSQRVRGLAISASADEDATLQAPPPAPALAPSDSVLASLADEAPPKPFHRWRDSIGRFQVTGRIGEGGMGVVYRARDPDLQRDVAIKVQTLSAEDRDASSDVRFLREARACASIRHPNVVSVLEVGQDASGSFLVMELVTGSNLHDVVKERRTLPAQEAVHYALGVARGLGAAHTQDLIHRDVKPGNVLITPEGVARLTDFGLVRDQRSQLETFTREDAILGTPHFLSPEQACATKGRELTPATDVYSLGATLYFCLTGRPPFDTASFAAQLVATVSDEPTPLSDLLPGIDPRLESIVARCLRKEPDERYANGDELAAALERVLQAPPPGPRPRSVAHAQLKVFLLTSALALCLTSGLIGYAIGGVTSAAKLTSAASPAPAAPEPSPPPSPHPGPPEPRRARPPQGGLALQLRAATFASRVHLNDLDLRAAARAGEALALVDNPATRQLVEAALAIPCTLALTPPPIERVSACSETEGVLIASSLGVVRLRPSTTSSTWKRDEFDLVPPELQVTAMAARGSRFLLGTQQGALALLEGLPSKGGALTPSLQAPAPNPDARVVQVAWAGGAHALTRDEKGRALLWSLAGRAASSPAPAPRVLVAQGASAIAGSERAVLVGRENGTLSLFSLTGEVRKEWPAHRASRVSALLALEQGWVSGGYDARLCTWSEEGDPQAQDRLEGPVVSLQPGLNEDERARIAVNQSLPGVARIYEVLPARGLRRLSELPGRTLLGRAAGSWILSGGGALYEVRAPGDPPRLAGLLPAWHAGHLSAEGKLLVLGTTDGQLFCSKVSGEGSPPSRPIPLARMGNAHFVSAIATRGDKVAAANGFGIVEISLANPRAMKSYTLKASVAWLAYRGRDLCVATKEGIRLLADEDDGGERTFAPPGGALQCALSEKAFLVLDARGRLLRYQDEDAREPRVLATGISGFAPGSDSEVLVARDDRIEVLSQRASATPKAPLVLYRAPRGARLRGRGAFCPKGVDTGGSLLAWGEETPLGQRVSILSYQQRRDGTPGFALVASLPLTRDPVWNEGLLACRSPGAGWTWWRIGKPPKTPLGTPAEVRALVARRTGWVGASSESAWVGHDALQSELVRLALERLAGGR